MSVGLIAGALAIAVVAGLFGSLLGLGGGIFIVPLLTGLLGISTRHAIGASVVAVVATSCVGSSAYLRHRMVNVPLGMRLELATVVGAIFGALSLTLANPRLLNAIFGLVMFYTGAYMTLARRREDAVEAPTGPPGPLDYSFYAPVRKITIQYRVRHLRRGIVVALVGGYVSGILGVGGGLFNVPAMAQLMGVPLKVATATSGYMIGVTGTAGAFIQYTHGLIDPGLALPVVIGVMAGGLTGPRLARVIPAVKLRDGFIVVILIFAVEMLGRAVLGAA